MKDLVLLPQTTITAMSGDNHAQLTIKNDGTNISAAIRGKVGGLEFGPVEKQIPSNTNRFAKAGALGFLLQQGLTHLKPDSEAHPNGLPVEIIVNDGGNNYTQTFYMALNLGALGQFQQILEMVRTVNAHAGR